MKTSVSAKRCPECGKAAMLQATYCPACNHRFRTRFVEPPVERTEAFTLMVAPPVAAPLKRPGAARTFRLAFLSSFALVAVAGVLLCLGWNSRQPSAAPPSAVPVSQFAFREAAQLYQAVKPAMSLYDLDQAAGSTGRIIRISDPHFLLLSYDYPHQTVHVLLSRTDTVSGDYQVQAVALYQGKTQLGRRSVAE